MTFEDVCMNATESDKTTKHIVLNKKTDLVIYYGTDGDKAAKLGEKRGYYHVKPMIKHPPITETEMDFYRMAVNCFY